MMDSGNELHLLPRIHYESPLNDMISCTEGEESYHYHILGYSWHGGSPRITVLPLHRKGEVLKGAGDVISFDLKDLEEVSFRFSGPAVCTGRFEDGRYIPCPGSNPPSESFSQCMQCLMEDLPDPTCLFEPHCHIEPCGAPFCQIPHVVYATAFRGSLKIGMTQYRRMKERAMEQGADGMLPLLLLKDRFSARSYEGAISRMLGLPQMVRSGEKLTNVTKKRDLQVVEGTLLDAREDLKMFWEELVASSHPSAKVIEGPLEFDPGPILIDDYPLEEPLPSKPKRFKGERVKGKVLGFKGTYMFFRQGGIWAYRLSEAPGKVLHTDVELMESG